MLSQDEIEMQNYCRGIEHGTMKAIKAYVDKEQRKRRLRIVFFSVVACTILGIGIYAIITS